jgi:hypothetical protein
MNISGCKIEIRAPQAVRERGKHIGQFSRGFRRWQRHFEALRASG